MKNKNITPVTIERIVSLYNVPHLDNDVILVDSLKKLPELTEARRMSLCLFIGLCTDGVASISVNDKKRIASRNNIMIITDESVVGSINFSDDFEGFGFFISYKLLQEILKDVQNMSDLVLLTHNHPVFEVNKAERDMIIHYFQEIMERVKIMTHRYRLEVVRLMLLTMIYDLASAFDRIVTDTGKGDKQSRAERIFVQFLQLVEHHYREQRQVQWYAARMDMSPKYLCEIISSVSRRSPNEWIDKFVTTEIRNQLRHTTKRISEIAKDMNFPTQSFLGKYFKENVGVSPSDYRNGIEGIEK